jgi:transposase-like protein
MGDNPGIERMLPNSGAECPKCRNIMTLTRVASDRKERFSRFFCAHCSEAHLVKTRE